MPKPLKARTRTLNQLQVKTIKVLSKIRKHLNTPIVLNKITDTELIEEVINPFITEIQQDISILKETQNE